MSRELSFKISYEKGEVEYILSLVQEYLEKEANYKVELNMKDVRFSKPRELVNVDPLLDTEMDFKITKSGYKGPRFNKVRFKRDVLTKSFAKVVDMGSGVFDILPEDRGFDDVENQDYTEVFKSHLKRDTSLIIDAIEKVHYLNGQYRIYFKDESVFNSDKFSVTCKTPVVPTPDPVDPVTPVDPIDPAPVQPDEISVMSVEVIKLSDSECGPYPYPFNLGGLYRLRFETFNYTKGIKKYIFSDKVYQATLDRKYDYLSNMQYEFVNNELVVTYSSTFPVTDYITPTPRVVKVNASVSEHGEVFTTAELDNGEMIEGPVYSLLGGMQDGSFENSIVAKYFPDGDVNFISRYFIPLYDYQVYQGNSVVYYNPQAERLLYVDSAYAGDKYVYRLAVPRMDVYNWENPSTYDWSTTSMFYSKAFVFDQPMNDASLSELITLSINDNVLTFDYDESLVEFVIPEEYKDRFSIEAKVFRVRMTDMGDNYSGIFAYRQEFLAVDKYVDEYPWMDKISYKGPIYTTGSQIEVEDHKNLFEVTVNPDGSLNVERKAQIQTLVDNEMDWDSDDIQVLKYVLKP